MPFQRKFNAHKPLNYTPLKRHLLRHTDRRRVVVALLSGLILATAFSVLSVRQMFINVIAREANLVREYAENLMEPQITWPRELKAAVEKELAGSEGTYAIAVKNLKTNEAYYLNEHKKFQTASMYKVWVMLAVMEKIKEGKLSEQTPLSQDVKVLNDRFGIASEEAELQEGEIQTTVGQALEKMITVSDNYSAMILYNAVGYRTITDLMTVHNLSESAIGRPPHTTAADMIYFYEKLHDGELMDEVYTAKMLDLLKRTKLNYAIPAKLPDGTIVAHKTGELNTVSHDAGIVYTQKGDYVIAILSESFDTPGARDRMARVSKAVFDYFTKG